jgi:hypothetical protein
MTEVLVGLIVAVSTVGGVLLTQIYERRRAGDERAFQEAASRRDDERRLRDEKRERVRAAYTDLLVTARLVSQGAKASTAIGEVEELTRYINDKVQRGIADLERSLAGLLLESYAQDVVAVFESVRQAYGKHRAVFAAEPMEAQREAGLKPATDLRNALIELEARVPELEETARRRLTSPRGARGGPSPSRRRSRREPYYLRATPNTCNRRRGSPISSFRL